MVLFVEIIGTSLTITIIAEKRLFRAHKNGANVRIRKFASRAVRASYMQSMTEMVDDPK